MASKSASATRRDRVTFVLPNYNHAHYLKRCLNAIFAQTQNVDELIIIDDGSTDDSIAIIKEMIAGKPCARLISLKENQGVIACLNMGLSQATGEFIAFVAADDILRPEFVESLAAWLVKYPKVAFACARAELRDDHGVLLGYRPLVHPSKVAKQISADEYRTILERSDNHILTPVTLHRRSVIAEFGGFDPDLGSTSDGILVRQLAVETASFSSRKLWEYGVCTGKTIRSPPLSIRRTATRWSM